MLALRDLSADQKQAFTALMDWTRNPAPLLTLGGYAGTGKSTTLGIYARNISLSAFCCFIGKASGVLAKKLADAGVDTTRDLLCDDPQTHYCGTIHSLIYRPIIHGTTVIGYALKEDLERPYERIILDEASTVSDELLAHLKSFGLPILAVGDHGQLMPVSGYGSLMADPDIRLEKIHRQAEDNPIIKLSAVVRETGRLDPKYADNNHVTFDKRQMLQKHLQQRYSDVTEDRLSSQASICYSNQTRIQLNVSSRQARKYYGPPKPGDQLICLKNDRDLGIYNGMRGVMVTELERDSRYPWQYDTTIKFDDDSKRRVNLFIGQFNRKYTFSSLDDVFEESKRKINVSSWDQVGRLFDFGYALTCHKAIGSQFEDVLLLIEGMGMMDDEEYRRWKYTAITRSSNKLTILI